MADTELRAESAQVTPFDRALRDYLEISDYLDSTDEKTNATEYRQAELAYMAAQRALIDTPASDIVQLRTKFDAVWPDTASVPTADILLSIFDDLKRLSGGAVSPLFRPAVWLDYFVRRGGMYCVRGDEVFLLQPEGAKTMLEDSMFELDARGGREAVEALIKERCSQEAEHA